MGDDATAAPLRGRDLIGLGGMLVGSVVVGLVLGYLLDSAAGTSPLFTLLGIALGVVLAGLGFWFRVRRALRSVDGSPPSSGQPQPPPPDRHDGG